MVLDNLLSKRLQLHAGVERNNLPSVRLTDSVRQYLLSCRVENKSAQTLEAYREFIGYFLRFLLDSGLDPLPEEVSRNHVRLFIVSLQDRRLAPETVSAYYRALHTFFNWLENEGLLPEGNPFLKLKAPKIPKKHVKGYTPEVLADILALCMSDHTFTGRRNLAIVLVLLDTGVRRAELTGMKLTDVIFDQGLIKVMGKGGKERIVKMGEHAQKRLLHYLLMRVDNYDALWVCEERRPMTDRAIYEVVRRIAARAGVPKTFKHGTHIYRHTGATEYLRNHGNVKCLQELLGHENIKTTMKYVDALGPEAVIEDHRRASPVDNLLGGKRK